MEVSRSKRRRTERKADLVDAARRAMLEHGSAVRLNQVAEEAGLTSGAVLYHYPDLRELLLEAHRAGMERFYDHRQKAAEGVADPARKLVVTVMSGLPVDSDDEDVRLLCELGGAAGRNTVYAALLTALYDRQVSMYQVILEIGAAQGVFTLHGSSLTIGRNLVALEDAYGYRMMARHPAIDHAVAGRLILDYARLATGHALPVQR
ncbi:AcrR family transcriptional regulator [Streptacidiphilus sp. MAP12-33]|uniref:TetR/AcrR family transcriptional regulator n=1 Tax=Streptacidiphilus sp. MAP12-33 TaxID=3156266 RepID=UPI003512DBEC